MVTFKMKEIILDITPIPKPRMVRSDSWKKRSIVLSYWAFKKELVLKANLAKLKLEPEINIVFYLPMPESWSKKKKAEMDNQPHKSTPDGDNILKAIFDCLCDQDNFIWKVSYEKRWSYKGKIVFR
jgi:Holliday junction resolvase RusA-like endonuclease